MGILVATAQLNGARIKITQLQPVTSGMVGAEVSLEFDSAWDVLTKKAVFKTSEVTKDVSVNGDIVMIPAEVLAIPHWPLKVSVYSFNDDGTLVIPSVEGEIGMIQRGSNPSGDESTDPTLPVWAELENRVSELEKNPGGVDPEVIGQIVEDYLEEHPAPAGPQGPQGEPGYTPVRGEDYWTEADQTAIVDAVVARFINAAEVAY